MTSQLDEQPNAAVHDSAIRPIPEFDGVHQVWPRGRRLDAVRDAALRYRERFLAQGTVSAVKSVDIAAAPYPARFAFQGYSVNVNPMITIINRMFVIQFEGFDGALKTMLWEPTVAAGMAEAPFYDKLQRVARKLRADGMFVKYYNDPDDVLPRLGLTNADVDYVCFDHLHVQDVRMILGCSESIEGEDAPRRPLFPNAKLLVHRRELGTFESMHPMQWAWYVESGMGGVPADRLEIVDGDVELGVGVSLLWTPGHTDGNQSLVINTPDGVWVSSENGMAADSWQPELSTIPGVRRQAAFYNREVVLNANTLEDSLDQYDSMVKEKTLASRSPRDPRWLQIIPSSECSSWKRQWPVVPTTATADWTTVASSCQIATLRGMSRGDARSWAHRPPPDARRTSRSITDAAVATTARRTPTAQEALMSAPKSAGSATSGHARRGRRYAGMDADDRARARADAIRRAALELFGTAGFAATSIKQICAAASLTQRYFYETFTDREAALSGVYQELVTELEARTTAAVAAAEPDTVSAHRAGLTAFVEYLTADVRRARVMMIEAVGVSDDLERTRHTVLSRFADVIAASWTTVAPSIDSADETVHLTAVALSGAVNNLLVNWLMTGQKQSPALLVEVCTGLFAAAATTLPTRSD